MTILSAIDVLKLVEFGSPHGRCPYCAGWENGTDFSRPRIHTDDCKIAAVLNAEGALPNPPQDWVEKEDAKQIGREALRAAGLPSATIKKTTAFSQAHQNPEGVDK